MWQTLSQQYARYALYVVVWYLLHVAGAVAWPSSVVMMAAGLLAIDISVHFAAALLKSAKRS